MTKTGGWTEDGRLAVTARLSIPADELSIRASRAGGPGGQHVNTASTRIEVTWDIPRARCLTDTRRERLLARLATRIDTSGTLRVVSAETRSQQQNRERALVRLAETISEALVVPKVRRPTAPTRAAIARTSEAKARRGALKRDRRWRPEE
ncbi:MAG: alternative ribosome rescue aminoacyl-tRNA hydrolase ArfB [Gemmatimonadaceae bacterium]